MTTLHHPLPLTEAARAQPVKLPAHRVRRIWFGTLVALLLVAGVLYVTANQTSQGGWTVVPGSRHSTPVDGMLALDQQGNAWITTDVGLGRLSPQGQWTAYPYPGDWNTRHARPAVDGHGRIWASNYGAVVCLTPDGQWTEDDLHNTGLLLGVVTDMAVDGHGQVWVGTTNGLIMRTPDERWDTSVNSGLADDAVNSIAVNSQSGGIWIGTEDGGVSVLAADGHWTNYRSSNSPLTSNKVLTIVVDQQGRAWLLTDAALQRRDPDGQWTSYALGAGFDISWGNPLAVDEQGRAWIGDSYGVHVQQADGRWITYQAPTNGIVDSILLRPNGPALIGTSMDLQTFDPRGSVPAGTNGVLNGAMRLSLALAAVMAVVTGAWGLQRTGHLPSLQTIVKLALALLIWVIPAVLLYPLYRFAAWPRFLALFPVSLLVYPLLYLPFLSSIFGSPFGPYIAAGLGWLLYASLSIQFVRVKSLRVSVIWYLALAGLVVLTTLLWWHMPFYRT